MRATADDAHTANLLALYRGTSLKFSVNADGECEITTAAKGIILKSPNGTRYPA